MHADMIDSEETSTVDAGEVPGRRRRPSARLAILLVVTIVFGAVLLAKLAGPSQAPPGTSSAASTQAGSITSVHNDAVADYAAALKTGRPVYVLFHSLTCDPCVQISAVADAVVPAYADTVAFVNAISDDPSGQELASSFQFQYIPTSFFLAADGTVVSSYTGVLSAQEMRARLDSLVAAQ